MKIGLSTCGFTPTEEAFKNLAAAGIHAVELSMEKGYMDALDFSAVKNYADTYGVEIWSCHLPFYPFEAVELSALDAGLRDRTLSYYENLIAKASAVGITLFVVHPSGEPIPDTERKERLNCAKESLARLADIAHTYGATIAVEDLPRSCLGNTAEELAELISANDKLRVCFDVNHLLQGTHTDFLKTVGHRILTVHISDYDFKDEKHWLPGEGDVDWQKLYQGLLAVGYEGIWMYELGQKPPRHLHRDRDLTFTDYVENAKTIFAGDPPKPLGERLV